MCGAHAFRIDRYLIDFPVLSLICTMRPFILYIPLPQAVEFINRNDYAALSIFILVRISACLSHAFPPNMIT